MRATTLQIVFDHLHDRGAGDMEAVAAQLHPDVVHQGVSEELVCRGREEVLERIRRSSGGDAGIDHLELVDAERREIGACFVVGHGRCHQGHGHDEPPLPLYVGTGACVRVLTGHTGIVSAVAFSPDGALIATASFDGTARLWEVATGNCLRILNGHADTVWSVAFSPADRIGNLT